MSLTEVLSSFCLSLVTDLIVMVGATSFFYWIHSSVAAPVVVAHRKSLALLTGFGFMAYLFAQMMSDAVYAHLQVGFHWTYLNMMILTLFILNMQLGLRWQALLDAGLIAAYYLSLAPAATGLGVAAVLVAGGSLWLTQAHAAQLADDRLRKYGSLVVFAAALLTVQTQISGGEDGWFWVRQLSALALLTPLCLEFEQVMRLTNSRTDRIHQLTTIDELTGVYNYGTFNRELEQRFAAYTRDQTPYTVFEGDLDHFKAINDTYGHPSGNLVLQRLALELDGFAKALPFPATAYRLGGEEFAIIAQADINYAQALAIGQDFQRQLLLVRFPEVDPALILTCSIGQARVQPGDYSASDVYKQADRNLYDAKCAGRNRVKAQPDGVRAS